MLDAKQESLLIVLAGSDATEGRDEWTMQLLTDKVVEKTSDETVRPDGTRYGFVHPKSTGGVLLELYEKAAAESH
jgi:3-oxoacyl-(acyl-carrier-protein) synthase